jgi:hypothetical protein
MTDQENKNRKSYGHITILILSILICIIWQIWYIPNYVIEVSSSTYFYLSTCNILLGSYAIIKFLLLVMERNDSTFLLWGTLLVYIVIYGLVALPFMFASFFQTKGNGVLHMSMIILFFEFSGRIFIYLKTDEE